MERLIRKQIGENEEERLGFCHLLGDYFLQTPYIAETKEKNLYHMFVHCSLYCFPFYLCFGLYQRILLVFLSHFLIDTLKARYDRISVVMDQTLHYMVLAIYLLLISYCMMSIPIS